MIAETVETPIAPVTVRITAADTNNDWLIVTDNAGVYPLKPSEAIELMYSRSIAVFGLTGKQEFELEYRVCS